jgi:predicted nicotinamide N-methyase
VELGAGSGVASLAAAAAGADATATDLVPDALALLRRNAAANGVGVATARLDWADAAGAAALGAAAGGFDVAAGVDVTYLRSAVRPVLRALAALLAGGPARPRLGVLVDPGRACRDDVEDEAGGAGLAVAARVNLAEMLARSSHWSEKGRRAASWFHIPPATG